MLIEQKEKLEVKKLKYKISMLEQRVKDQSKIIEQILQIKLRSLSAETSRGTVPNAFSSGGGNPFMNVLNGFSSKTSLSATRKVNRKTEDPAKTLNDPPTLRRILNTVARIKGDHDLEILKGILSRNESNAFSPRTMKDKGATATLPSADNSFSIPTVQKPNSRRISHLDAFDDNQKQYN